MLLLQILGIVIYIIFAILLLDLFYADKRLEYIYWRRDGLEVNIENEWLTNPVFWKMYRSAKCSIWILSLIPLINIAFYMYMLWTLNHSSYTVCSFAKKLDKIEMKKDSINSYIWPLIRKL